MHAPELLHCSVLESRSVAAPHDFHSHAQLSTLKLIARDDDADELHAFECDDVVHVDRYALPHQAIGHERRDVTAEALRALLGQAIVHRDHVEVLKRSHLVVQRRAATRSLRTASSS